MYESFTQSVRGVSLQGRWILSDIAETTYYNCKQSNYRKKHAMTSIWLYRMY